MTKSKKIVYTIFLRLIAFCASISATIVMATSHQSVVVYDTGFTAKYSDTPTFKYFVIAYTIASGYTLVAILLSFKSSPSSLWHIIMLLDLVMTVVLSSSISAALAIGYVGKKGNTNAGWLPICEEVPKLCDHVTGALVSGFVALVIYMLILVYTLHNVTLTAQDTSLSL